MRIVSLLPSATEILFALGVGDQVVGVTHKCDYPIAARQKPRLTTSSLPSAATSAEIDRHVRAGVHAGSSLYALDRAMLETLAPDLIVTQELCEVCAVSYDIATQAVRRLAGDPRVVSLEPTSLGEVYGTIFALGGYTGRRDAARSLVHNLRARETAIATALAGTQRPTVLVPEWIDPPFSASHWTPGLVELAGGVPLCSNPGGRSRAIGWHEVISADPDIVVVAPCGFNLPVVQREAAALGDKREWKTLRAVQQG